MKEIFKRLLDGFVFTGDLHKDTYNLLILHNRQVVAEHSKAVGEECKTLAIKFGINEEAAEIAGLLHDISAIFPFQQRLEISSLLGIQVLKEEEDFPLILHQKISQVMAKEIWNISNEDILSAIGCHTTLKREYAQLDLLLFVADKIKWDQKGDPEYLEEVISGLDISLEHGAYAYIKHLMDNKSNLKVVHPWLIEAYDSLRAKLNEIGLQRNHYLIQ